MSANGQAAFEGAEPEPARLHVRTARQVCDLPDPDVTDLLLGPLVIRGARTILAGDTGAGKTTMALQIVAAIVTGEAFLDWQGLGDCRCLFLDLEQGVRSAKRSLREAGLDESDDVEYVLVPDGLALGSDPEDMAALEAVLAAGAYDLVVLDPWYKAHRGDGNDERAVVDLMRALDALRVRHGFALLMPVHPRKRPPGERGARVLTLDDIAGSAGLFRGAEVIVGVERVELGVARLRFMKDRDGDLPSGEAWPLLFERGDGFRRDPEDGRHERDYATELSELGADDGWRTLGEWAVKTKGGIGAVPDTVRAVLGELVEAGRFEFAVGPPGRAKAAKCWRQVGVYVDSAYTELHPVTHSPGSGPSEGCVTTPSPFRGEGGRVTPTEPAAVAVTTLFDAVLPDAPDVEGEEAA